MQPDVLLVNEFDFVEDGLAAELFRDNFLAVSQNGAPPASYPYYFVAPFQHRDPVGLRPRQQRGDRRPQPDRARQRRLRLQRVRGQVRHGRVLEVPDRPRERAHVPHLSDPKFDTADFSDFAPGNLRADYVLPRRNIRIADSAVFWPVRTDPLFRLTGVFDRGTWGEASHFPTSDHRLVWADLDLPGVR